MFWKTYLKYLPLPLLLAAYPVLFLFGHNASTLDLGALLFPLGASLLVAGVVYTLFCLVHRKPLPASLSAAVFVLFYYLYGSIFHLVTKWSWFPGKPFVLLPLVIALAIAIGYPVKRIRLPLASTIQRILLIVSAMLVMYNVLGVTVPAEAQKVLSINPVTTVVPTATTVPPQKKPDIYYIIFDEYAGFDAIRSYWHDSYVDQFETFLQQNNFFVASGSRSTTINTGAEIASRLNLQPYAEKLPNQVKVNAIDNSKVMQVLKANGYTTVAIDMYFAHIQADETIQYGDEEASRLAADRFEKTFLDTTMFNAFSGFFQTTNQTAIKQRSMILYSLDKTVNPGKIETPKFVYTHVLLPHEPFIFDQDGNLLAPQSADDWTKYLGQHKYATKLAKQLITKLLAQADPNNPPVIILQSDHGARNLPTKATDGTILNHLLPNYSLDHAHEILNALYLPGFDTSQLSKSMDPIETFVIVLNFYLNAGVKVNPTPAK